MAGTTVIRSHVDVDTIGGLTPLRGVALARSDHADLCDIQLVAFPQEGIWRDPGTAELMAEAMRSGADVVGGMPHWCLDQTRADGFTFAQASHPLLPSARSLSASRRLAGRVASGGCPVRRRVLAGPRRALRPRPVRRAEPQTRFSSAASAALAPGRHRLTRPATSVTRKIWPVSISNTARTWPMSPAGTRLP